MKSGRLRASWILLSLSILGGCANGLKTTSVSGIDLLMTDPALNGANVSLMVRDARSGKTLYQSNAQNRLIPGSGMKLLTTAAAMEILGPQYRFSTQLLSTGRRQNSRLIGNLYLKGMGDPSIQWADYQALAAKLAQAGIKQIQGDLIFDDSFFDSERLGVDWAHDDETTYYGAQISALTLSPNTDFDAGALLVTATAPDVAGLPVQVTINPPTTLVQINNRAISGVGTYDLNRRHGTNLLQLSGAVTPGDQNQKLVSVWEPTQLVANLFEQALSQQGIEVTGQRIIGGLTPASATLLTMHESAPLQELLTPLLKLSNNNMSEVLLKTMGRKTVNSGTATAGVAAVANFLASHGQDITTFVQVDGSGLSRRNLVSAQDITGLLYIAGTQPWFDTWYTALPIAGNSNRMIGGTLRNRLKGTAAENNLHAKTGSLNGVSSLSGYITDTEGRRLVFSMLTNNYMANDAQIKALEDRLAVALARASL